MWDKRKVNGVVDNIVDGILRDSRGEGKDARIREIYGVFMLIELGICERMLTILKEVE